MDHRFSKHEHIISCSLTLVFVGLIASSYFDISVSPFVYEGSTVPRSVMIRTPEEVPERTLRASLSRERGVSCHMVDIIVWVYILGLIVFMSHKYITYRIQGLHYFFLDYCYFHNAVLVFFLLWRLVDVQWSEQPVISWARYMPASWHSASKAGGWAASVSGSAGDASSPLASAGKAKLAARAVLYEARGYAWDGVYMPVSFEVLTCGYVVSHMTGEEVLSSFVVFTTLVAGTFGPILGAILMWRNALLFHSFDRMSSCYIHLLPGTVQGLLLHFLFNLARRELVVIDPARLFHWAEQQVTENPSRTLQQILPATAAMGPHPTVDDFVAFATAHRRRALCVPGTLCHSLRQAAISYRGLLIEHFIMFCVWQVFYHVFNESRRRARQRGTRRRMLKKLAEKKAEFMRLTGSTEEEAEMLHSPVSLSESVAGDPSTRVTAYTWLMEHPPGGTNGILYRFVTCLGMGRLPTTILFQVAQWIIHFVFFTAAYPVIYASFRLTLAAWPLLLLVAFFLFLCICNAAAMDQKWTDKLRMMAEKGVDAERKRVGDNVRASSASAAAAAPKEE